MAKRRKHAARTRSAPGKAWYAVLGSLLAWGYLVYALKLHGALALVLVAVGWVIAGLAWLWALSSDAKRQLELAEADGQAGVAPRPSTRRVEASSETPVEREVVTIVIGEESVRAARIEWTATGRLTDGRGLRLMDTATSAWIEWVRGIEHYRDRSSLAFSAERQVRLVPEPDNPYDPNAVAVMSADGRLKAGHLPGETAAWVVDMMQRTGASFSGIVLWESRVAGTTRTRRQLKILMSTARIHIEPRVGPEGRATGSAAYFERMETWGQAGTRWVSQALFTRCVERALPSHQVVHEASPAWLGGQRLDVFVETMGVAFEYQGQQHYEPVSVFGGDEALAIQQRRDAQKREACRHQEVYIVCRCDRVQHHLNRLP